MDEEEKTVAVVDKSTDVPSDNLTNLTLTAKDKQNEALAKLLEEDDLSKVKDLTHLFNMYQAKRNALRINTLNDVQDALVKQMLDRLEKYPDNFNNKDIADWMKTVQMVMDTNNEKVEQLDDIPTIKYQQNNQVNVNVIDRLSRESREKITNVLEALMNSVNNDEENMVLADEIVEEEENSSAVENLDESE